jgi:hypothetical protein
VIHGPLTGQARTAVYQFDEKVRAGGGGPAQSASVGPCDPTVIDSSVLPAVQAVITSSAATAAAEVRAAFAGDGVTLSPLTRTSDWH